MVPSLLSVYSDVEHTDRANQFYAKFNMRQYIGEAAADAFAMFCLQALMTDGRCGLRCSKLLACTASAVARPLWR